MARASIHERQFDSVRAMIDSVSARVIRSVTASAASTSRRRSAGEAATSAGWRAIVWISDATPDLFSRSLAVARALPDDHHRADALRLNAIAQAYVGLRDEAAHTFAEAAGLVSQDGEMLSRIAVAQRSAEFIAEAAVTFEHALTVSLSGDEPKKVNRVRVPGFRSHLDGSGAIPATPPVVTAWLTGLRECPMRRGRCYWMWRHQVRSGNA